MRFDEGILALPLHEPRHVALARRVEQWCDKHGTPFQDAPGDDATGRQIIRALGDDGWLAPLQPGSDTGTDCRSLCLIRQGFAYTADLVDFAFSIQSLAATPILRYGDEAQQRYLAPLAAGTVIGSFAISEEAAGSDLAAIGLHAQKVPGGYVLTGGKAWIANGGIADVHCVLARTGEGPGAFGLTAFLVPADAPGLRPEPVSMIAPRCLAHLHFTDCYLPASSVLGRPGAGFAVAAEVLDLFRMTVGAAALGFSRRAADAALDRARGRRIYSGRLFDLPTVKAILADVEVDLAAAALLVARAAWEADHAMRTAPLHSSIAKLFATEQAQRVVDAAVQLHGAAGLVHGGLPERLYRQIRSLRIYEGASEVQRTVIAGALGARRVAG